MKKICLKIITTILIILLLSSFMYSINAADMSEIVKSKFSGGSLENESEPIKRILSAILDVVRTIGATVAIVILMVIGTKYIIASAGDRADIKKYAINYVIGALILFSASGILGLIKKFVEDSIK